MKYRKLRIAWSVVCAVVCVLLIALWVRSNYWVDQVFVPVTPTAYAVFSSMPNAFGGGWTDSSPTHTWAKISNSTTEWLAVDDPSGVPFSGARFFRTFGTGVAMPYWFGVLLTATFAATPWLRWRFSLRTLLIATTLVALVLGLIVWKSR